MEECTVRVYCLLSTLMDADLCQSAKTDFQSHSENQIKSREYTCSCVLFVGCIDLDFGVRWLSALFLCIVYCLH